MTDHEAKVQLKANETEDESQMETRAPRPLHFTGNTVLYSFTVHQVNNAIYLLIQLPRRRSLLLLAEFPL